MDCNIINCMFFPKVNTEVQGEKLMKLSSEELEQEKLKPETPDLAFQQVGVDRYVVFESVLERNLVEASFPLYGLLFPLYGLLDEYAAKTDSNHLVTRLLSHKLLPAQLFGNWCHAWI